MAESVIYVRGKNAKAKVLQVVREAAALAAGNGSSEASNALMVRMGLTALSLIKTAFVQKAAGGTDEAGDSWPPLKRSTIAYSRKHPGVPLNVKGSPNRAAFAPSWMLTDKQRKRWWALCATVGPAGAWIILKSEGAKTLIGEYGDTPVQILRDKGLLLNSLSPGLILTQEQPPNPPPTPPNQIFDVGPGEVIVGTNRKGAAANHTGIPGKLPQRRLWPNPNNWPASWWSAVVEQGRMGLVDILLDRLKTIR
jgi:hypothetical protein